MQDCPRAEACELFERDFVAIDPERVGDADGTSRPIVWTICLDGVPISGGRKLTYASTTVKGTLTAKRNDDLVRGQVSLTASASVVNVSGGSGEVTRQFSFEISRK